MDVGSKKLLNEAILEEMFNNGVETEERIKELYPSLAAILLSSKDSAFKERVLKDSLKDPKIRAEIQDFDKFKNFDFEKYQNDEPAPSSYDDADIKDVQKWYDKAKKALDPTGKGARFFSENPLYTIKPKMNLRDETESYDAFEHFEDPEVGGESQWFDSLLSELGYPDTPEGWEQLATDWNAVMSRKKWADKAEKYPSVISFIEGNSMKTMKNGYKPGLKELGADAFTNAAFMVPSGVYLKALQTAKLAPKVETSLAIPEMILKKSPGSAKSLEKSIPFSNNAVKEAVEKYAMKAPSLAKRVWAGISQNMVAPAVASAAKAISAGPNSPLDIASDFGLGTIVNIIGPADTGLRMLSRPLSLGDKTFKAAPGEIYAALRNAYSSLENAAPTLTSYFDNKLGNDAFAESLKRYVKPLINRFVGNDEDDE